MEDFRHKFIPTVLDYLGEMNYQNWMHASQGEYPFSAKNRKDVNDLKESSELTDNNK